MPSFIFMLSALYMKVRNRSRSRIARESRQRRQRRDQKEWFSWKSRAMAIEEDPTRGSEPAGGAARLFAALLVNDSFCWTRITHKLRHREEKKAAKCHQNRRSYQHHPSAARGKARPPQQAISFLPLCRACSILHTFVQKSNLVLALLTD